MLKVNATSPNIMTIYKKHAHKTDRQSFCSATQLVTLSDVSSKDQVNLVINNTYLKSDVKGDVCGINSEINYKTKLYTTEVNGNINGNNFTIASKPGVAYGNIDGSKYYLEQNSNSIAGQVGNKKISLDVKKTSIGSDINGIYQDKPINLTLRAGLPCMSIKGNYDNKKIDLNFDEFQTGVFSTSDKITGSFNGPSDLLLLIVSYFLRTKSEILNNQIADSMVLYSLATMPINSSLRPGSKQP